jgi:NADH-quinone oxidoreductase subunit A
MDLLITASILQTAGGVAASPSLRPYLPVLLLIVLSLVQAVMMVMMSHMASPTRRTPAKSQPYESGITPLGDTRQRFSVKFYLVAILFIVFDLETIFLIPWAVVFRDLGLFGLVEMLFFVLILAVGLVYAWKKGALQWD